MATRTQSIKRTATKRQTGAASRKRAVVKRKPADSKRLVNFYLPLALILCLVSALGFLLLMGYRTVTASAFFDVKTIDVRGANRVPRDEIERVVRAETRPAGVWNASLDDIRAAVERFPYVKTAVVSRVLPDGVEVRVEERTPRVVVRTADGDFWADEEAVWLGEVGKNEMRAVGPVIRGWDESKTERAQKENQERVRLYLKMLKEWQELGIARRAVSVSLADLQDPQVAVEDSGATVLVNIGREDHGKRLLKALDVIEGKGKQIESMISHGGNVVAKYRNS